MNLFLVKMVNPGNYDVESYYVSALTVDLALQKVEKRVPEWHLDSLEVLARSGDPEAARVLVVE